MVGNKCHENWNRFGSITTLWLQIEARYNFCKKRLGEPSSSRSGQQRLGTIGDGPGPSGRPQVKEHEIGSGGTHEIPTNIVSDAESAQDGIAASEGLYLTSKVLGSFC